LPHSLSSSNSSGPSSLSEASSQSSLVTPVTQLLPFFQPINNPLCDVTSRRSYSSASSSPSPNGPSPTPLHHHLTTVASLSGPISSAHSRSSSISVNGCSTGSLLSPHSPLLSPFGPGSGASSHFLPPA